MSTLTIPNPIVAGTPINSSPVNANFAAIATWANGNVDNSNIGALGLYASQIKPLTAAQATFGATATGVGYKFLANDATATPLTVSGVSAQSVDIQQWTPTSGGSVVTAIDKNGGLYFPTAGTLTATYQIVQSTNVLAFNVPTGKFFEFFVNGVAQAGVSTNGFFFSPAAGLPGGATGSFFQAGAANSAVKALDFGNALGAGRFSRMGSLGDTVNTIVGSVFEFAESSAGVLATMDATANLGLGGTLHQTSHRALKQRIQYVDPEEALKVVLDTKIARYDFISEDPHDSGNTRHASFIADETPWQLSGGPGYEHADPQKTASYALAAIAALYAKVVALEGKLPAA